MISMYGRDQPRVLEGGDFRKSPWIHAEDLETQGAVYVSTDDSALPDYAQRYGFMRLRPGNGPDALVYWAVVPPAATTRCDAGDNQPHAHSRSSRAPA